jgi:L-iditol 2-dehydrogenase
MKALVLTEYKKFELQDVPTPEFGEDEVLIEVKACGICGSDVHGMDGSTGRRRPPVIMGHEAAGVIAQVGPGVTGWKVGDRVTFDSTIYCGRCWFCRRGQINLCDNRRVLGVSCEQYRQNGAFAQFVAVPQHILYRLPDGLSFERAAMVEALSVAVHAVERTVVHLNDTAVVVGAGMIGLLVIQVLRARGCGRIIAVDIEPGKLELAGRLGATDAIRADMAANDAAMPPEVAKLTAGRGADVAFEVVGMTPTLKTALASLRKGGQLTLVGNISPSVELPLQSAVTREITINGTCASCGEYGACLDLIASGKVNVDALISAAAPLADGAKWFDRLYGREKGLNKVILTP